MALRGLTSRVTILAVAQGCWKELEPGKEAVKRERKNVRDKDTQNEAKEGGKTKDDNRKEALGQLWSHAHMSASGSNSAHSVAWLLLAFLLGPTVT